MELKNKYKLIRIVLEIHQYKNVKTCGKGKRGSLKIHLSR
jgi:hypothetical protein